MTYKELFIKYNYHKNLLRFCSFLENTNPKILEILDTKINSKNLDLINLNIDKILSNYPVEYLLNYCYFYNLKLYINESCLIPRDETEELVKWIIDDNKDKSLNILDICCGSGCIGLALKSNNPKFNITCSDISKNAIDVTNTNSNNLNLDINTIVSNLFDNINFNFDIIVSNPPYIGINDKEVSIETNKFEPHLALYTNDIDGLEFYKKIFDYLKDKDFKYGYFEIGYNQKEKLIELLNSYNCKYEFKKDINNHNRMLKIKK